MIAARRDQEKQFGSNSYQHLHVYKIRLTQELKPADHGLLRIFFNRVPQNEVVDGHLSQKVLFSDEAHFHLNSYGNKQNHLNQKRILPILSNTNFKLNLKH